MSASLPIETFFWLPHCSTCQKAEGYLLDAGATIQHYVDLKASPIAEATLRDLVTRIPGGTVGLFSKRAMKFRSLGLDKQVLTDDQLFQHMLDEYTFIKRPVILTKAGVVLAGFSAKAYDALLKPVGASR
jgi:arsenate reductase (glutaredoxin)